MAKKTLIQKLSDAMGSHGDLELIRDATVAYLRKNTDPYEQVGLFSAFLERHDPFLPHDRWFQRIVLSFLMSLNPNDQLGCVVEELEKAELPLTVAEKLERRAAKCIVPGLRGFLLSKARRARMMEQLIGARY
ncbi:hypothetical protein GS501_02555 [Saccharibacter sp. 17.LH.SD]|uniref:hypothetical protein n=1 Tax=Saccharibacter sp. 17.LH.SD TaxID=2689393 RepID=UPI0013699648|nr:hypothetical protein [Saccharibacter sp. 17.LH.SD]MXV43934.1 hypothetical protein [Saccharibacter sp. 17.LH.SD]